MAVLNITALRKLTFGIALGLLLVACEGQKDGGAYLTVITTLQPVDTTGITQKIQMGHKVTICNSDTAFIKENVSYWIVPFIRQAACVREIEDLSNNDSSIIVITLKEEQDIVEARNEIDQLLKVNRTNLPMNLVDPIVIQGRPEEW